MASPYLPPVPSAAPPVLADGSPEFIAKLGQILRRGGDDLDAVVPVVREILAAVRRTGEEAVLRYIEAFERRTPRSLIQHGFDGPGALARLTPSLRAALELAADRITRYHERQLPLTAGFRYEEDGIDLGMRVRPLERVGVYAPGGKARYPSSVLMAAIPARVAGVRNIVLATPAPNDLMLAAAHLAGVSTLVDAGGAHAIGAMAYGLSSLPRVDKIVGPGNAYVTCAKRLVFGDVAIDGIAGPSEIVVVADEGANAALVAADLLSQAEHDEAAYAIVVTTSPRVAEQVRLEIERQLPALARRSIVEASLAAHGAIFLVSSSDRLFDVVNALGGEHVALHVDDPEGALAKVSCAGAVLLGRSTPVALGDYVAGPSHVLPTGGSGRHASPLGVYDFVVRSSVIRYDAEALQRQGALVAELARAEGLDAHARAIEHRFDGPSRPQAAGSTPRPGAPSEPGGRLSAVRDS
jgi:histidinol dehydrogenase